MKDKKIKTKKTNLSAAFAVDQMFNDLTKLRAENATLIADIQNQRRELMQAHYLVGQMVAYLMEKGFKVSFTRKQSETPAK